METILSVIVTAINCNQNDYGHIDDDNVLSVINGQFHRVFDEMEIMEKQYYTLDFCNYYALKVSTNHVFQTDTQTRNTTHILRLVDSSMRSSPLRIDSEIGMQLIRELVDRTVDREDIKICSIENVNYEDKNVYFTMFNKYKKYYDNEDLERWLFHGTDTKILKQIEKNGFDRNFNKTAAYGKVTRYII